MADNEDTGAQGFTEERVCEEGAPEWVVTFGDMMSLLLTFFILLLSFSTVDAAKFRELAGSIKRAFGVEKLPEVNEIKRAKEHIRRDYRRDERGAHLRERLKRNLTSPVRSQRQGHVEVEVYESYRGVVVLFSTDDLFVAGSDRLRAEALPLLAYVLGEAANVQDDFELAVEVHAEPDAPRASTFPNVWSLTTAQALALARHLRRPGGLRPDRVRPVGRGPAPPTPRPGRVGRPPRSGSTVEFLFLSRPLGGKTAP